MSRSLVPRVNKPVIVPTRYGFRVIVDPVVGKGLEEAIYQCGTYEAGTLDVMRNCLRSGDTFVDVGANIGFMSLFASQSVGESGSVYAFEPNAITFEILTRNIRLNDLRNIHAIQCALASDPGRSTLYHNLEKNRGSASFVAATEDTIAAEVQVATLDEFTRKHGLDRVRMIKLDVEGWELSVLKGARRLLARPEAPILCLECSSDSMNDRTHPRRLYACVTSLNRYSVFRLRKGKENRSRLYPIDRPEQLPKHDNLFCFLPEHLKHLPAHIFDR